MIFKEKEKFPFTALAGSVQFKKKKTIVKSKIEKLGVGVRRFLSERRIKMRKQNTKQSFYFHLIKENNKDSSAIYKKNDSISKEPLNT